MLFLRLFIRRNIHPALHSAPIARKNRHFFLKKQQKTIEPKPKITAFRCEASGTYRVGRKIGNRLICVRHTTAVARSRPFALFPLFSSGNRASRKFCPNHKQRSILTSESRSGFLLRMTIQNPSFRKSDPCQWIVIPSEVKRSTGIRPRLMNCHSERNAVERGNQLLFLLCFWLDPKAAKGQAQRKTAGVGNSVR